MKIWHGIYNKLTTKENIFHGWREFLIGKKKKKDVKLFMQNFPGNFANLCKLLQEKKYKCGSYSSFYVRDPKLRLIHKATVRDRIVHHIVSSQLELIFEPTFIAHSYSCRKNKGTHKGIITLQRMALKVSKNNKCTCWSLKMDIKKFFPSVNHKILFKILSRKIQDDDFLNLLWEIIDSFYSDRTVDLDNKKGIPIGNLTSQLFSNIYLNELDQFMKHKLKVKYYLRYADDFVMLSDNKNYLENLIPKVEKYLNEELDLEIHPNKIIFEKFSSGIDFLGYIVFPYYVLPRTKTKKRLLRKIKERIDEFKANKITKDSLNQTIQSYLGYLGHANTYKFRQELQNQIWFWLTE